jgi:hypothetical protein
MNKEAVFTLKLEQGLRDEFVSAAEASDLSPSQVLQELMQDFILQKKMAPDYVAFLQDKAALARNELTDGQGLSGDDVEREFSARRAAAAARMR